MVSVDFADCLCMMPLSYRGDWYSMENTDHGDDLNSVITEEGVDNEIFNGACHEILVHNLTRDAQGNYDSKILLYSA